MRSSDGRVILRNVTEFASGMYKCEVTAAGTFRTLAKELSLVISGKRTRPLLSLFVHFPS